MYENDVTGPAVPVVVDLFAEAARFDSSGRVRPGPRRMMEGDGDWQMAMFHAETDEDVHADYWEKHPEADEAVCCVRGALSVIMRSVERDSAQERVELRSGQAVLVPRDRWHRLEVPEPTDLLTVSVRDGSRLELRGAD